MTAHQHRRPIAEANTQRVLEALQKYMRSGISPSCEELASEAQVSKATVSRHIEVLISAGFVIRMHEGARGIVTAPKMPAQYYYQGETAKEKG